jgi:hypothetical protein
LHDIKKCCLLPITLLLGSKGTGHVHLTDGYFRIQSAASVGLVALAIALIFIIIVSGLVEQ